MFSVNMLEWFVFMYGMFRCCSCVCKLVMFWLLGSSMVILFGCIV